MLKSAQPVLQFHHINIWVFHGMDWTGMDRNGWIEQEWNEWNGMERNTGI